MKRLLVGVAPTIVVLLHAMGPPSAEAHWFGRCGGWYSPRYSCGYGYSSCYYPSYYGYSNGYSNYGYSGYSPYGGYGGYGGYAGFGGNSALTTILAMNGGLGGGNTSMYMTVPLSNGWGPASLLQVPIGGAAGRSTFLQVPMGGGPGQPVYLQLELGGAASAPPASVTPRQLGDATAPLSDRLTMDEAVDPAAVPYVVSTGRSSRPAATAVAEESADDAQGPSSGLFHFAVLQRRSDTSETPTTPAVKTAGFVTVDRSQSVSPTEELDLGPNFGVPAERNLSDGSVPWKVK